MSKYKLDHELYYQTVWFIRRYYEFVARRNAAIGRTPKRDGGVSGGGISDPTAAEAALIYNLDSYIDAIEKALAMIPAEYRAGIWAKVIFRASYPPYASELTYKRWKQRFIFHVAHNMKWVE